MYNNDVSQHPTHFLRGAELVWAATEKWGLTSENWAYPSGVRLGTPGQDDYYGEVWFNGMDYQHTYWVVHFYQTKSPECEPMILFASHDEENKIPAFDLDNIFRAILDYQRARHWIQQDTPPGEIDLGRYTDSVWPYLCPHRGTSTIDVEDQTLALIDATFSHASAGPAEFRINKNLIPEAIIPRLQYTG